MDLEVLCLEVISQSWDITGRKIRKEDREVNIKVVGENNATKKIMEGRVSRRKK
jgi:hypothetical protein